MTSSTQHVSDFIDCRTAATLPALFAARVARSPQKVAYQQYDARHDCWRKVTWQELAQMVARWRAALKQESLHSGDRIALILRNCIEWVCFDQAAQSLGLVVVSLYTTDTEKNLTYILADAGVRLLLVEESEQWHKLAEHQTELPDLQTVWCLHKPAKPHSNQDEQLQYIADLLPATAIEFEQQQLDPAAIATLIYTSGTTGSPKGVMLTHQNLLSNAEAVQQLIPAYPDDVFLSFLPMAHGFERTVEYLLPMMAASCVVYARSIPLLVEDLQIARPTVFISAPRLYEKMYVAIKQKIAGHLIKRKLFDWTVQLGWQRFEAEQKRRPPLNPVQNLLWRLLNKLVASKVRARLGGRLRVAVTGAAPLSAEVIRFFLGLGLPLLEGYGLTEAGPVVSGNSLTNNVPGSVGMPLPGVEVSLASNGELLVRSDSVMRGYWQHAQATQQVLDEQGWLHTGDLAELKDSHIFIRGRAKEILVTSTGEKIPPADMEAAIIMEPLFEQALVVGEGKPFLGALLVLNTDKWLELAQQLSLNADDPHSLQDPELMKFMLQKLAQVLHQFPGYAQIRAVYLTTQPWTIDNGMLTPTLKIRRTELESRYAKEIKALYRGHVLLDAV